VDFDEAHKASSGIADSITGKPHPFEQNIAMQVGAYIKPTAEFYLPTYLPTYSCPKVQYVALFGYETDSPH
jgi:hypothetical protein